MEKTPRTGLKLTNQYVKPADHQMSEQLAHDIAEHLSVSRTSGFKLPAISTLSIIYDLLDRIVAEMPTVCRKGCAHCCKIEAEITPVEVEYIVTFTDHKVNTGKAKLGTYCPFLDTTTATCTIYDLRPFNCRAFAVFNSPEYCKTGDSQFSTGSPAKWAAPGITELQQELLSINNITGIQSAIEQVKDIRWYFK